MANGVNQLCRLKIAQTIASRTIALALHLSPTYFTVSQTSPGIQQLWLCQLLRSGIARSLRGYKRYSFHG
jgi:hypothetical protein